jgi:hypothetical protein
VLAVWAPIIGACSSDVGLSSVNLKPEIVRPDWLSFSGHKEEFSLRPPGPADLVGPEGQCAGTASASEAVPNAPEAVPNAAGEGAAPALVQGGIALQMTECDVVRRAGPPERVEFGTSERGDRSVVLTYIRGPRPGVYRFVGGRLFSVERGPEAPAPAKPQKAAASKKRT